MMMKKIMMKNTMKIHIHPSSRPWLPLLPLFQTVEKTVCTELLPVDPNLGEDMAEKKNLLPNREEFVVKNTFQRLPFLKGRANYYINPLYIPLTKNRRVNWSPLNLDLCLKRSHFELGMSIRSR